MPNSVRFSNGERRWKRENAMTRLFCKISCRYEAARSRRGEVMRFFKIACKNRYVALRYKQLRKRA